MSNKETQIAPQPPQLVVPVEVIRVMRALRVFFAHQQGRDVLAVELASRRLGAGEPRDRRQ